MQCDPSTVSYNEQSNFSTNRSLTMNQPSCETEDVHQPHSESSLSPPPPPYAQYSQEPISSIRYIAPSAQRHSRLLPHQQRGVFTVPNRSLIKESRVLTIITTKLQAFFIISGIFYILLGVTALSTEVCIIIYSYSTYYRGIWMGMIMLPVGINMILIAHRVSHPMFHVIRLLYLVLSFCMIGLLLCLIDWVTTPLCRTSINEIICDIDLVHTFKLIISGVVGLATIYNGVNLMITRHIQRKTVLSARAVARAQCYRHRV